MDCNDETTVLEQQGPSGINSENTSMRSDETNLYKQIDKDHIFGLNLSSPEQGSICIKPWDKKDEMGTWTESGVDDQVSVNQPSLGVLRRSSSFPLTFQLLTLNLLSRPLSLFSFFLRFDSLSLQSLSSPKLRSNPYLSTLVEMTFRHR
jgi:hypothetical protein